MTDHSRKMNTHETTYYIHITNKMLSTIHFCGINKK